ncbi:MAG: glycosyltransferase family 2 protein [Methylococcales bacterium]
MYPDQFRVSIIISSYNQRAYLSEALESVMGQTLRPYEIIIADDASSDGSQVMIRAYSEKYPDWVKYGFQPSNSGIPKNRNAALRRVRGNYVGILDGDDLFVTDKLEKQFEALCRVPNAEVVYSNFHRVQQDGKTLLNKRYASPQPEGNILAEVARFNTGILRTLVADYRAVQAAGFMEERYPKFDGLWLAIKLAACCRFAYVHEPLVLKREHSTSDSRANSAQDLLHDLSGIHEAMKPYCSALDATVIKDLDEYWKTLLASLAGNRA